MTITTTQSVTKCNSCGSAIPAINESGSIRLNGTTIDFCANCSKESVYFVAQTFTGSLQGNTKKVRTQNGQTITLPLNAKLPAGATLVYP